MRVKSDLPISLLAASNLPRSLAAITGRTGAHGFRVVNAAPERPSTGVDESGFQLATTSLWRPAAAYSSRSTLFIINKAACSIPPLSRDLQDAYQDTISPAGNRAVAHSLPLELAANIRMCYDFNRVRLHRQGRRPGSGFATFSVGEVVPRATFPPVNQ